MKKTVLFTFDYELFLGNNSGSVQDCMIEPTNWLIDQFARYAFQGIFFVDTVYLLRLREVAEKFEAARADYALIREQLTRLVKAGHEIHIHLHPHWLDAEYNAKENTWALKERRYYQFSNLPAERRPGIIDSSVELLKSILKDANIDQPVDSYRAGGWAIQPFAAFRPHFMRHDIRHEFSVFPGKYYRTDVNSYDFRNAPLKPVYPFQDDECKEEQGGAFREWTISAYSFDALSKWLYFKFNGVYMRLSGRVKQSGDVLSATIHEQGDIYLQKNGSRRMASFEQLNPYMVWKYLGLIRKNDYFQFISHPKLIFAPDRKMLKILFSALKAMGNIETNFRKSKYY